MAFFSVYHKFFYLWGIGAPQNKGMIKLQELKEIRITGKDKMNCFKIAQKESMRQDKNQNPI